MSQRRTLKVALFPALATLVIAASPFGHAWAATTSGYHDPITDKAGVTSVPPLAAADAAILARKESQAAAYAAAKLKSIRRLAASGRSETHSFPSGATSARMAATLAPLAYSAVTLLLAQIPQSTYYYCGPATVSEILGYKGHPASQATSASWLGTTTAGTDWYTGSSYPVAATLTAHNGAGFYYEPHALPGSPTATDVSTFTNALFLDLDSRWPIAGDAWEANGGPHLVGHPVTQTIFHWFAVRAYSGTGASTGYADSVYNAVTVSWHASVTQPYSSMTTSTVVTILGGRGYVF